MPKSCCVTFCTTNKAKNPELKFILLPSKATEPIRRTKWLHAIRRGDDRGRLWDPSTPHVYVCSRHFVSGLKHEDEMHPDYVPSVFPDRGKSQSFAAAKVQNSNRGTKRELVFMSPGGGSSLADSVESRQEVQMNSPLLISGEDKMQVEEALGSELTKIRSWLNDNQFSLHLGKTESILFGSKPSLSKEEHEDQPDLNILHMVVCKEEDSIKQESSPIPLQDGAEPPHIKDEQEKFEDEREELLLGPEEPDGSTLTLLATKDEDEDTMSHCSRIEVQLESDYAVDEDSGDWEETGGVHSPSDSPSQRQRQDNMADDLSAIPDRLFRTFEFTSEDVSRVILKDSLFDSAVASAHADPDSLVKSLKTLAVRETQQYLDAVSLSDYLRHKIIPRALRIQNKAPAVGFNSPEFLDRWCEILNKCSLDLMALVIKETSEQLAKTREEIELISGRLDIVYAGKTVFLELMREIDLIKDRTFKDLKCKKCDEFARDTKDYRKENVYFWRKPAVPDGAPPSQRDRPQGLPPTETWPSSSSVDSNRREGGTPFVGDPTQRHCRGGRRGRGRTHHASDESEGGYTRDRIDYTRFNSKKTRSDVPASQTRVFYCSECPYAFTSQVLLHKHIKRSHNNLYCQMLRSGLIPVAFHRKESPHR